MAGPLLLGIFFALLQADIALNVGPLTVFHSELALALLLPWALWQAPKGALKPWGQALAPLGLWFLLLLGGPATSGELLKGALRAAQFAAAVLLPTLLLRDERGFRLLLRSVLFSGMVTSLWAIAQSWLGPAHAVNAGRQFEVFRGFQSAAAGFGHHNQLGAALAPLFLAALLAGLRGPERRWGLAALGVVGAGLFCSYSRGSWAGLLLASAIFSGALGPRQRRLVWGGMVLVPLAAFLAPWQGLQDRLQALFSDSDRIRMLGQAWRLWEGHAFWGWGPGALDQQIQSLAMAFREHDGSRASFSSHLHNSYLQLGLTWGWPVLLAWAAFAASVLRRAFKKGPSPWAWALAGAMAAFFLQAATDHVLLHARGMVVAFLWGLMLAGASLARGGSAEDRAEPGIFRLGGRRYFAGPREAFFEWLFQPVRRARSVHVANVHTHVSALWDPQLRKAQSGASVLLADGRPLSLAGRLLGCWNAAQLRGPDLMLWAAQRRPSAGHFYYGGAPGVAREAAAGLRAVVPGLRVAGCESPPFHEISEAELGRLAGRIKRSRARLVWIGLGAPKQEKLMDRLAGTGLAATLIGVGAAFDLHAGRKAEAPPWMRALALEWAFRLGQEPGRLWSRYLSTNPLFLLLVAIELLGLHPATPALERLGRLAATAGLAAGILAGRPGLALAALGALLVWGRFSWRMGWSAPQPAVKERL